MREFKFRAFHKDTNKIIDIKNLISFSSDGDIWLNENNQYPLNVFSGWVSKDFELMQYAGLKDKNLEDIYEMDIIKLLFKGNFINNYVCEFKDGCFMFREIGNDWIGRITNTDMEVIGNIYENPELLESNK